jgi:NAD(P)-dependent dehydrogenase (short-subunit alcohol dehydrogenase family)
MIWPLTILPRWDGRPLPSTQRFDGLTILVTGASGGLGLAAAKKLASQGASKLIVTARNEAKAQTLEKDLKAHFINGNIQLVPTVIALPLEMNDPRSINAFTRTLKTHTKHLDHAILNAGLIQATHAFAPTKFEMTIQINTISTSLLAFQLLPFLLSSPQVNNPDPALRPHLTFVSSAMAWTANLNASPALSPKSSAPLTDLSQPDAFPPGATAGGPTQYGRSKLLLEHVIRRLVFLPSVTHSDGTAKVLLTSVCPHWVATELGREYEKGWLMAAVVALTKMTSRTPDTACNIYISSLGKGEEVRGEMWKDDQVVGDDRLHNVKSPEGLEVGQRVWRQMKELCLNWDAEDIGHVRQILGSQEIEA